MFGGGVGESVVNPLVFLAILSAGLLICVLPRRWAIAPFLLAGILIPTDQIVVLAGLHFPMLRLLVLFGFLRIFWSKLFLKEDIFSTGVNALDIAFAILTIFVMIDGILLWMVWGEVVYQLGYVCSAFGVYLLLRFLIRDEEDICQALKVLACVTIIIAAFMIRERMTGRNPFYALLGGARADLYSSAMQRQGSYRATGCFGHPLLAGAFGGFMLPLFFAWWWKEPRHRKIAALAIVAATVIPFTTGSSTALFALFGAIGALLLWPLRRQMRLLRWGIVAALVSMQMIMKSPIWHLIERVHLVDGSTSYDRYQLVNQCILHFSDWALVGTKNYASWGWSLWDLCNQYVAYADASGLIPLIAFIALLVYAFKYLGIARRYYESDRARERFVWAISASLFANVVAFMGVSYFDQTIVGWYAVLAIISVTIAAARKPADEMANAAAPNLALRTNFRNMRSVGSDRMRS